MLATNIPLKKRVPEPAEIPATAIALIPSGAIQEVGKGKYLQFTAVLTPANSTDAVTWTSSQPANATVDQTGRVYGVKSGSTSFLRATATSGVYKQITLSII